MQRYLLSLTRRGRVRRLVAVMLVVGSGVGACASDAAIGPDPDIGLSSSITSFVQLLNDHRTSLGCPALSWNDEVAAVAQAHSEDMVARDFFSHTNPDGDSPFDRLHAAGISYTAAAENIAYGYPSAEAVLEAWLGSPGHRANIENCSLSEHGVGLDGTHWTHLFIRP
jgi:uncharacterized protein YkwD